MPTTDSNKATMFYYIKGTEPNYDENLESLIPTIKEEKENDQWGHFYLQIDILYLFGFIIFLTHFSQFINIFSYRTI